MNARLIFFGGNHMCHRLISVLFLFGLVATIPAYAEKCDNMCSPTRCTPPSGDRGTGLCGLVNGRCLCRDQTLPIPRNVCSINRDGLCGINNRQYARPACCREGLICVPAARGTTGYRERAMYCQPR